MKDGNPIIVVDTFNSIIEANIVKAKLDAYGIPCFLSEEHLTSLTTHILSGGVRLHIFEQDLPKAREILSQKWVHKTEEDDLPDCPKCRSKRIMTSSGENWFNPSFIVKIILQLSKTHFCLDCGAEFDL